MASKRRRGRPRKIGRRYRSGKLKPTHDPTVSPAAIAATQPHRKGLGDHALDQRAESELGRMVLRSQVSDLQYQAGQRYAAQWRAYLATMEGPTVTGKRAAGASGCRGCPTKGEREKCACDLARRLWVKSWVVIRDTHCGGAVNLVVLHDLPCLPAEVSQLRGGLDALAVVLGLTTRHKSDYRYASSQNMAN